ncbi:MAG: IS200/IS605 family transposase [Planctomycetota bacterium]
MEYPYGTHKNLIHIVFSTKNREPLITNDLKPELENIMAGIIRNLNVHLVRLNSVEEHCHLLIDLPATMPLSEFVNKLKSNSSRLMNKKNLNRRFGWQNGYGAFSVSQNHCTMVSDYIDNQAEHHKTNTMNDEFARLLAKNGMEPDEQFSGS